jgi:ketosteroid isomerase-like protein
MQTQQTSATNIEENINLVKTVYDCFFRGDTEGLLAHHTDDIDWEVYGPAALPTAGPRHGKEEVQGFFGQVNDLLQFDKFEVQQYIAQGNSVVSLGEYNGKSKTTGKNFDSHFAHVVTIRDGKVCKFREFTDTAVALEAMT